jgi:WS/DGAT/MGAT family acyltransferase
MLSCTDVQPTFRKHPAFLGGITNVAWAMDKDIELDYHLRRSALPAPGKVRDLLELTSRLHGSLLDRHRPLWETHLVEGLDDGRYALYCKMHHALIDGVSAQRLMQRALTPDPDDDDLRVPWELKPRRHKSSNPVPSAVQTLRSTAGSIVGLAPSVVSLARAALIEQQLTLPFRAPKTLFNVRIGGARRAAAQSWSLERFKRVKAAAGGVTVNDVVLAMCAGALRAYLIEQSGLPETPLVAMVPVSLRTEEHADRGGNMVGTILCNLATNLDDPAQRLDAIHASMSDNKTVFSQLPQAQQFALSAFLTGGIAFSLLPGFVATAPPPFNIVISNVPGPREPIGRARDSTATTRCRSLSTARRSTSP